MNKLHDHNNLLIVNIIPSCELCQVFFRFLNILIVIITTKMMEYMNITQIIYIYGKYFINMENVLRMWNISYKHGKCFINMENDL